MFAKNIGVNNKYAIVSNLLAIYCPLGAIAIIIPAAKAPIISAIPKRVSEAHAMNKHNANPNTG